MAKRTHVVLVDDLSGDDIPDGGGGSVQFGLDGVQYNIDLSDGNAERLRGLLAEYVAAGTRVAGRRRPAGPAKVEVGSSAREIRDWARSNGYDVPGRGRIPSEVREAFEVAH